MKNTFKAIAIVGGISAVLGVAVGLLVLVMTLTDEHPKVVLLMVGALVFATVVSLVKHDLDVADRRRPGAENADVAHSGS